MITKRTLRKSDVSAERLSKEIAKVREGAKIRLIIEHPNFPVDELHKAYRRGTAFTYDDMLKGDKITKENSVKLYHAIVEESRDSNERMRALSFLISNPRADSFKIAEMFDQENKSNLTQWAGVYRTILAKNLLNAERVHEIFEVFLEELPPDGLLKQGVGVVGHDELIKLGAGLARTEMATPGMLKILAKQQSPIIRNALYQNPKTPIEYAQNISWGEAPTNLKRRVLSIVQDDGDFIWFEHFETIGKILKNNNFLSLMPVEDGRDTSELKPLVEKFKEAAQTTELLINEGMLEIDQETLAKVKEGANIVRRAVRSAEKAWRLPESPEADRVKVMTKKRLETCVESYQNILSSLITCAEVTMLGSQQPLVAEHQVRGWEEVIQQSARAGH